MSILVLLSMGIVLPYGPASPIAKSDAQQKSLYTSRIEYRIVKSFEFDERRLGNFESMPMNWFPIIQSGYPRFGEAVLDEVVGHDAPPSLHFPLTGGNVGAIYQGHDIPIYPGSDYRVSAWIRPDRLKYSNVCFEAYYLDSAMKKIESSRRSSPKLVGEGANERWAKVVIDLPPGPENAKWIGLSCRVTQSQSDKATPENPRPIVRQDVAGGAWLDDVTILRLPQVALELNSTTQVYDIDEPTVCTVKLSDLDGAGLSVSLEVWDADDRCVELRQFDAAKLSAQPTKFKLKELPAGLYTAKLLTNVGDNVISMQSRTFLRLNSAVGRHERSGQGFGIYAEPTLFSYETVNRKLLQQLSANLIKIPLWYTSLTDDEIVHGESGVSDLVERLEKDGTKVIGVLDAVPQGLAQQYDPAKQSIIQVLATDPAKWRPYLAFILTRFGQRVNAWQIGSDDRPLSNDGALLSVALANLRAEMQPLIGLPRLVLQRTALLELPPDDLPAHVLSLRVADHREADQLTARRDTLKSKGFDHFWVSVAPPAASHYDRQARLAEFARSMVAARCSGAEAVFAPQPWRIESEDGVSVVTPKEEFILLRTLSQMLAGLDPVMPLNLSDGVEGWLFSDGTEHNGALVVWSDGASLEEKRLVLDVDESCELVDLWGNAVTGKASAGGRQFTVGAIPSILRSVKPRQIKMITSLRLDNAIVDAGQREHQRKLQIINPSDMPMNGYIRLRGPSAWRVRPNRIPIDLAPRQSQSLDIAIRVPSNQAAGNFEIVAELYASGIGADMLTMRTPVEVATPGLDVNVMAYKEGDDVRIVQRITNKSNSNMNLRAYVIAPDKARDVRFIHNLAAGDSAVRDYVVDGTKNWAGRNIRVTVEDIDGKLKHNDLISLP